MKILCKFLAAVLLSCLAAPAAPATEVPAKPLVIEAKIPRPGDYIRCAFGSVWMMSGAKLVRVNPADNTFTDTMLKGIQGPFRGIAMGEEALWLPDVGTDLIHRFDPTSNAVTLSIPAIMGDRDGMIGVGEGSVWVTEKQLLTRFNAATGKEEAKIELPGEGVAVAVAFGSVWITSPRKNKLYRIDAKTNVVAQTIALKPRPHFMVADQDTLWILDNGGFVQSVDGKTGEVKATIETGPLYGGSEIDVGDGFIWATSVDIPLMAMDPQSNSMIAKFHDDKVGDHICFGGGAVWISGDAIYRVKVR
jgi:virginiamycin B lyase